jgi:hypothetical protein
MSLGMGSAKTGSGSNPSKRSWPQTLAEERKEEAQLAQVCRAGRLRCFVSREPPCGVPRFCCFVGGIFPISILLAAK